jgi:Fe-S cluster assembly protein SufD
MNNSLKRISFKELFTGLGEEFAVSDYKYLNTIKKQSLAFIRENKLPTLKNEEWQYTDVSKLIDYNIESNKTLDDTKFDNSSNKLPSIISPVCIVFVNGIFNGILNKDLSKLQNLPDGIVIESISQAMKDENEILSSHLNDLKKTKDSFTALNNLFIENGIFIHIKKNIILNEPIQIIYINNTGEDSLSQHPRNIIIMEEGAKAYLLEEYYGKDSYSTLINSLTEIKLEENSELSYYLLQHENNKTFHISTVSVQQDRASKFSSQTISFGGDVTRNNIYSDLNKDEAFCSMNGIYIINDKQHLDNYTHISHISPNCTSSQLYHGILTDEGRGVFTGSILVNKDAQKTVSTQSNNSLMLSEDSRVDTKPQLKIYADDVQCSHAATIGQIDQDSLYYLRARGIDLDNANKMLTLAFSQKITDLFDNKTIKDKVEKLITKKMKSLKEK